MKTTVFDDIKEAKGLIVGVITFAATVTGFLVTVLDWDLTNTTVGVTGLAVLILFLGWMNMRSEKRQLAILQEHMETSEKDRKSLHEAFGRMEENQDAIRKDTLRIQLVMHIKDQPENVDTILRLAEEYFVHLHGDWYMTSEFYKWADEHNVRIPPEILGAIRSTEGKNKE